MRLAAPVCCVVAVTLPGCARPGHAPASDDARPWVSTFHIPLDEWTATGRSDWFILEPGYRLVLEAGSTRLVITVLDQTRRIDGVTARVVEERESRDGELVEVSRNFLAMSTGTGGVYYFGEEVDHYAGGGVVSHDGTWRSGVDGARFGLLVPGRPRPGQRFHQEYAPGLAMDRAEVISLDAVAHTPAGRFDHCLLLEETTPLEPGAREHKLYAPGIGLVQDGSLQLVAFGTGIP